MDKRRIISLLTAVSALLASALLSFTLIAAEPSLGSDIAETLDALVSDEYDSLVLGDEWLVLAAHAYDGILSFDAYAASALAGADGITSAVERQRVALALTAVGLEDSEFVSSTPDKTVGEGGVMSYVFGLHLANNGVVGTLSAEDIAGKLLDLRLSDGGWSVRGEYADVDVTAMAITALAPHYDDNVAVSAAVDAALALLSSRQNEYGGFSSFGVENAESSAQVMIALCSLGRDPACDADFTKNGHTVADALASYRLQDGTYSHTPGGGTNKVAALQALTALVAQKRLYDGCTPFYIIDQTNTDAPITDTAEIVSDTIGDTTTTDTPTAPSPRPFYKTVSAVIIAVVAAVVITVMKLRRKCGCRDCLIVALLAALAVVLVFTVEIKTPDEYFAVTGDSSGFEGYVTLSVDLSAILGKSEHIPDDGLLLAACDIGVCPGDTVRDVTVRASRIYGLVLDFDVSGTYLRGIDGIGERDFGDLSGWTYSVNGELPSIAVSDCTISPGDVIKWIYVTGTEKIE